MVRVYKKKTERGRYGLDNIKKQLKQSVAVLCAVK